MQYKTGRKTVYGTRTDSYLLASFRLAVQPQPQVGPLKPLLDQVKISFMVRNLFDIDYATPGGLVHLQPAIPQNGRNYVLRVGYEL